MNCLNFFGYSKSITTFEKKQEFESFGYNVKVICHAKAWNSNQKIKCTVLGILAILVIATGVALGVTNSLRFEASMGIVAAGSALLLADVAVVLFLLRMRKPFVEMVAESVSKKKDRSNIPTQKKLNSVTVGKAKCIQINSNKLFSKFIIYRPTTSTFYIEYFESINLYNSRVDHYGERIT